MQEFEPIFDGALFERERDSNAILLPLLCGCAALTFTAGFGAWVLSTPPVSAPQIVVASTASDSPPARRVANPYGGLIAFAAAPSPAPRGEADPYGALVDLQPDSSASPARPETAGSASAAIVLAPPDVPPPPERNVARVDAAAPLPPARPPEFAAVAPAPRGAPRPLERAAPAAASVDDRNVFQKLFGLGPTAASPESSLAYAAPEADAVRARPAANSALGSSLFSPRPSPPAGYDRNTAVYDISARTVYLPDGTRLEAHSGLGDYLDDHRHVEVRMRGATPPHLYELQPREELFHGVAALRLVPVGGDGSVYGRDGLLAHSYMLGPNGDSNGCVSFKDYDAFLKAFQDGKVTRLAVVAKL
ncbi:MAG: tlde1 domain-containing protein [Roseiarcus sp.]